MRGKIIQYNGNDGSGIIIAEGMQYPFGIATWRAERVPATGLAVEVEISDDKISAVTVVGDDVLLKEKAAELGGKLGSAIGGIDLAAFKGDGAGGVGGSILARYGKVMLGAYAAFLIGSLMLTAVSISMFGNSMGKSLFDIASLLSQMGANGGGGIKMMLILAYVGAVLPILWRDRRAWLALLLPLIATLWAIFAVMRIANSMGGGVADMSGLFSIDFGFYLTILAAAILAGGGLLKFVRGT